MRELDWGKKQHCASFQTNTNTKVERRKREVFLEMKQLQKAAHHPLLLYSLLWSSFASTTACLLQPLCCLHSVKKRYVVVLFCRIGTIQNHSYELPLPSPLDIFKDDPQQKNVTKGERICHYQIDDLMLWLPI